MHSTTSCHPCCCHPCCCLPCCCLPCCLFVLLLGTTTTSARRCCHWFQGPSRHNPRRQHGIDRLFSIPRGLGPRPCCCLEPAPGMLRAPAQGLIKKTAGIPNRIRSDKTEDNDAAAVTVSTTASPVPACLLLHSPPPPRAVLHATWRLPSRSCPRLCRASRSARSASWSLATGPTSPASAATSTERMPRPTSGTVWPVFSTPSGSCAPALPRTVLSPTSSAGWTSPATMPPCPCRSWSASAASCAGSSTSTAAGWTWPSCTRAS